MLTRKITEKYLKFGGYTIVVEPRVLVREYGAKWLKARINLGELASLRREGWKTRDLAERYGVSLSAVKMAIHRSRLT